MRRLGLVIGMALVVGGLAAQADSVTAKRTLELANQKITEAAQNNLLWMEGTLSDANLRPTKWEVTFYDPERLNAGTMVRMEGDAVVKIGGAVRLFDDARWKRFGRNFSGYNLSEIITLARWKLDSDEVVAKVSAHPRLATYSVVGVNLLLRKPSDGDVAPTWRVKVLARIKAEGARDRWVGSLTYNAETGELLRDELSVK